MPWVKRGPLYSSMGEAQACDGGNPGEAECGKENQVALGLPSAHHQPNACRTTDADSRGSSQCQRRQVLPTTPNDLWATAAFGPRQNRWEVTLGGARGSATLGCGSVLSLFPRIGLPQRRRRHQRASRRMDGQGQSKPRADPPSPRRAQMEDRRADRTPTVGPRRREVGGARSAAPPGRRFRSSARGARVARGIGLGQLAQGAPVHGGRAR